ncbi:AAA family ATPase [Candidatus Saccharibacteria bacterium]|nr:MAG: AAA family ATPase [Candidatus Saccharibacteria bacterium]
MMQKVLIFRGAPASGKSTIVPEIAKLLTKPVVLIEEDKFRWGFHIIGRSVSEVGSDEHRFAYENTRMLYERYLEVGMYSIVLEGLFTWNNKSSPEGSAKELVDLAEQHGFEAISIVLTAEKEELRRRNTMREYTVPAKEFEELYNGVHQELNSSEIIIDTTNESTEETIARLKLLLSL